MELTKVPWEKHTENGGEGRRGRGEAREKKKERTCTKESGTLQHMVGIWGGRRVDSGGGNRVQTAGSAGECL